MHDEKKKVKELICVYKNRKELGKKVLLLSSSLAEKR